jgi:uncharacterized membrane protein
MGFLQSVFAVCKFFFGLGALLTLIGIGLLLLWYCLRFLVQRLLSGQPPERNPLLRKLFLEP